VVVDVEKLWQLATVYKGDLLWVIGRLSAADLAQVLGQVCRAYCPDQR